MTVDLTEALPELERGKPAAKVQEDMPPVVIRR
jgi:hypothetical protein